MVHIFHDGGQPVKIPLDELQNKTPTEVIEKIIQAPADGSTFLTRCGVRFPCDQLISSSGIVEDDFLRIVHVKIPSSSSTSPKQTEAEIDSLQKQLLEQYKNITQREQYRAYYHEILTRMTDPDFFQQKLQEFPELAQHPEALPYLAEPMLLFTILKDSPNNRKFCHDNPALLLVIKGLIDNSKNVFQRWLVNDAIRPGPSELGQGAPPLSQAQPTQPVITAEFLQHAINFAMGSATVPPITENVPVQAAVQQPVPAQQNDPLAEARRIYADELHQMRECGFTDDETNLNVLIQCQGNVATAMEILIEDANP